MYDDGPDLLAEFLLESHTRLDQMETDLVALELTPASPELLASVFRAVHTIKGTSGLLGLNRVERVAHSAESTLVSLRDGDLDATPDVITALREVVRGMRVLLGNVHVAHERERTGPRSIGQLWDAMPQLVDHLAARLGRQVELEVHGHATEIDEPVLEAVRGPLTHLVRNALDHGLEPPEVRIATGKPEAGRLLLRATVEHDEVVVEVVDDGRGIDLDELATAALARGLVTAEELRHLAPDQVQDLVFRPGLTTAVQVTSVSGRGVGLDVVRTGIEGVGGSVEVVSSAGQGTTCRLRVPRRQTLR